MNKCTKVKELLVKICVANNIEINKQQIEIQIEMMKARFTDSAILAALTELCYETDFFPTVAKVSKKIKELSKVGNEKSIATEKANDILSIIHECGFNTSEIKERLGHSVYKAIGGSSTVNAYGLGDIQQSTLIAQMRDAIMPIVKAPVERDKLKSAGAITPNGERMLMGGPLIDIKKQIGN